MSQSTLSRPGCSTAVALTGGGARGAYEAGVLLYVLNELTLGSGRKPSFDVFTGTSVGALNACALAAGAAAPDESARHLCAYWREMSIDRIFAFGPDQLRHVSQVVLGQWIRTGGAHHHPVSGRAPHPPVAGLLDTMPLRNGMKHVVRWPLIQKNLRQGIVHGVAVCATEVCTARSVTFYQTGAGGSYRLGHEGTSVERAVELTVEHALASAAIPFLFPAVQIDGICYTDGIIRQNVPLNPAIRFGATRILLIGMTQAAGVRYHTARLGCQRNRYPGAPFLLGRTVNAMNDGMLEQQLKRLEETNELIRRGFRLDLLTSPADDEQRGRDTAHPVHPYRLLRALHILPSQDLNDLAIDAIREAPHEVRLSGLLGRLVSPLLRSGTVIESELASYLLFTPTYARKLIDLGYHDARQRHDELVAFFAEEEEPSTAAPAPTLPS